MEDQPTTPPGVDAPFRLAMREEGQYWNASIKPPAGVEGQTILIASIAVNLVKADRVLYDDFVALMKKAVEVLCRDALGAQVVEMAVERGPESERTGHA